MSRSILQQERLMRIRKKKHEIWDYWNNALKYEETPLAVKRLIERFGIQRSWAYTLIKDFKLHGEPSVLN